MIDLETMIGLVTALVATALLGYIKNLYESRMG